MLLIFLKYEFKLFAINKRKIFSKFLLKFRVKISRHDVLAMWQHRLRLSHCSAVVRVGTRRSRVFTPFYLPVSGHGRIPGVSSTRTVSSAVVRSVFSSHVCVH